MKIYSIYDPEFKPYGKVLEGYDTAELVEAMKAIDMPAVGTAYEPSIKLGLFFCGTCQLVHIGFGDIIG